MGIAMLGLLNAKTIEIYFFDTVKLPRKYIRLLGWKTDDKLFACMNQQEKTIDIFCKDDGAMELCKGRIIQLPHNFCKYFGWTRRDKLNAKVNVAEGKIQLSLHKKLKLKCQDCRTSDNVMLMNNSCFLDSREAYGICGSCLSNRVKRLDAFISKLKQKCKSA